MAAPNTRRQREERDRLERLVANSDAVFIVHYACQSFTKNDGASARVASIAIRNFQSGNTVSYSIHQEIELNRYQRNFDALEKSMLEKFFSFIRENKGATFVHWSMRDNTYGFPALEHRYRVLGGSPYELSDHRKLDLALVLMSIYGNNYIPKPSFENLAKRNKLTVANFIPGGQEPHFFEQGEFRAVLQSNLCKVTLIADILQLAADRTLKTDATLWTLNFLRMREFAEMYDRNPVVAWTSTLAGMGIASFSAVMKMF